MTQYLSDKLRVLSLYSIILVLFIHSGFHPNEIQGMGIVDWVQEFISGMIGRCAVPLFYLISGYLFFLKVPNGMNSILAKMKKRAKTLLIPYVIGCLFFVVFLLLIEVLPGISRFMNGGILSLFQQDIGIILFSIFLKPCAFQLWFLRNLILIVATAPLWYVCLKHLQWGFVALVFALTFIDVPYALVYSLFWFVFGGQLTKHEWCIGGAIISVSCVIGL